MTNFWQAHVKPILPLSISIIVEKGKKSYNSLNSAFRGSFFSETPPKQKNPIQNIPIVCITKQCSTTNPYTTTWVGFSPIFTYMYYIHYCYHIFIVLCRLQKLIKIIIYVFFFFHSFSVLFSIQLASFHCFSLRHACLFKVYHKIRISLRQQL